MARNEGETPEPDSREDYEAAVLDFLDREMAAVQPAREQNQQSEELDALVSDLLKQVISESDQPGSAQKTAFDGMEDVLSEFPPREVEDMLPRGDDSKPSSLSPPFPTNEDEGVSRESTEETLRISSSARAEAPAFAPVASSRNRMPMIAIAAACLLIVIAAATYYFSRPSKSAAEIAESQPAAGAQIPPATPDQDPAVSAPTVQTATAQREVPARADKPSSPSPSSGSASGNPGRKAEITKVAATPPPTNQPTIADKKAPEAAQPVASDRQSNAAPVSKPAQNPSGPLDVQTAAPEPSVPVPTITVVEPTAPPISNDVSLAISGPDSKPAPLPASVPLNVQKPAPNPQTAATASAASRNLVPAVPISQVSPIYPELAVRSRTSGSVVLDLQIDKEGRVVQATPVSGPSVLYKAAIDAAMKWRYAPAMVGGNKVSSQSRVTMVFNLKN